MGSQEDAGGSLFFNHPWSTKKREYYKLKNNSNMIIATYLEERSREAGQQVNLQEEKKIHTLLTINKSKERSRRLHFIQPK